MNFRKRLKAKSYKLQANQGQAALTAVFFFLGIMLAIALGFTSLASSQIDISRTKESGARSYFLAEAGQEDVVYRIKTGRSLSAQEVIFLAGDAATTSIVNSGDVERQVTSSGNVEDNKRTVRTLIDTSDEIDFNFGVHVGEGGAILENSSSVDGNLFSNGPVHGANQNIVKGSVISAGPSGLIDGVHATGTAYAHTILNAFIEGDAHYQVIDNTTVLGTEFPGSEDQTTSTLAIPDSKIEEWKTSAEAGGIISCDGDDEYTIKNDTTLGPVKINCDMEISGKPIVTLEGMVWVVGDVTIKNSATVRVSPSLVGKSLAIIADNPSNRLTSSRGRVENTTIFIGPSSDDSFILLISWNESAEMGGNEQAIEVSNQADAGDLLVFAGHGEILLTNKMKLREVSAYRVRLRNTAEVIYKTGLANLLFDSGPGAGYKILDWKEVE